MAVESRDTLEYPALDKRFSSLVWNYIKDWVEKKVGRNLCVHGNAMPSPRTIIEWNLDLYHPCSFQRLQGKVWQELKRYQSTGRIMLWWINDISKYYYKLPTETACSYEMISQNYQYGSGRSPTPLPKKVGFQFRAMRYSEGSI